MYKKQKQSSKLLKLKSFNVCKNIAVLMIVMLGHLKLDTEVSDVGIEATESDNCREVLRDNGDFNSVLAMAQKRARFFLQRWTEVY